MPDALAPARVEDALAGVAVAELTQADGPSFWCMVGPLATSKAVIDEMGGYPILVTPDQIWVIAARDGAPVATACLSLPAKKSAHATIEYLWVHPELRGRGQWLALRMTRRLEDVARAAGRTAVRAVTQSGAVAFKKFGFVTYSQRGSWHYMEKAL